MLIQTDKPWLARDIGSIAQDLIDCRKPSISLRELMSEDLDDVFDSVVAAVQELSAGKIKIERHDKIEDFKFLIQGMAVYAVRIDTTNNDRKKLIFTQVKIELMRV